MGHLRTQIPTTLDTVLLAVGRQDVRLTNLRKLFWPALGITKGALLQYYADVASLLLPHLRDRPMVMKRYPGGAAGAFFFMKRAPVPRPSWVRTCEVPHGDARIAFPVVDDVASLLWVINLGCIDLNQWYARCDDLDRPDYLHFDLDPGPRVPFAAVAEAAALVGDALRTLRMRPLVKTSGSRGLHVYVPIVRGPSQAEVWTFARALAGELVRRSPRLLTVVYRKAARPPDRVLVDYNQNASGRTLASVYSVRPTSVASVSTPVTWDELAAGAQIEDFRLDNVRERFARTGDLWKPLLAVRGRADLSAFLG